MTDYPNARDCHHGHLRRKCEFCQRDAEILALRDLVRRAIPLVKHLREQTDVHHWLEEAEAELADDGPEREFETWQKLAEERT